jgi:outer membrane immunogenic protein
MRGVVGAIVFMMLLGTSASADDAAPQAVNWTGFYLGGNVGGAIGHAPGTSDFTDTSINTSNPQSNIPSSGGFLGGAQTGFNWQFSPIWVAGIEADWDWASAKYSFCRQTDMFSPSTSACSDAGDGFEVIGSRPDWLATFRGRLGVSWRNWLFYATGGSAVGRIRTDTTLNCLVDGCGFIAGLGIGFTAPLLATSTSTTTKAGWVAGFGAEWLYIDLGTISNSLPTEGINGTQTAIWSRNETFDEFRLGVSYLFH